MGHERRVALADLMTRVLLGFFGLLFFLPMLWVLTAPFSARSSLAVVVPWPPTLKNFATVFENHTAMLAFGNSLLQGLAATALVVVLATTASYVLSRLSFRGRDLLLYILILFSSVVSGVAAMVPLYVLNLKLGLLDRQLGVILVYAGGLIPTAIFILKDFIDNIPRSYEEAAWVDGSSSGQILTNIVFPLVRPGMAVIAVWAFVNAWGNFLVPFILLRSQDKIPVSVAIYGFFNEMGLPLLGLISAYSLLYATPVAVLYIFVNRTFGFRFYGGIKG